MLLLGKYQRIMLADSKDKSENEIHKMKPSTVSLQQGVVVESESIIFEDVPIVSPNGDTLSSNMSFEVRLSNQE